MFKKDVVAKAFQMNQSWDNNSYLGTCDRSLPGWAAKTYPNVPESILSWMIRNTALQPALHSVGVECTHITIAWATVVASHENPGNRIPAAVESV